MDASWALKSAENSLRDFITRTLKLELGEEWESKCGVTENRLTEWRTRKERESAKQTTGFADERLIYYADFYDLKTILHKNWERCFVKVFGNWKEMEVFLSALENLRNPDAHRRELLPHQHHLALGISGEIRTLISRYLSKVETGESCFPRIESVCDNLGTIYIAGESYHRISKNAVVRPGDVIDLVATANDPLEENMLYSFSLMGGGDLWQPENSASVAVKKEHVGLAKSLFIKIKSPREFHARDDCDDLVVFDYDILPPL